MRSLLSSKNDFSAACLKRSLMTLRRSERGRNVDFPYLPFHRKHFFSLSLRRRTFYLSLLRLSLFFAFCNFSVSLRETRFRSRYSFHFFALLLTIVTIQHSASIFVNNSIIIFFPMNLVHFRPVRTFQRRHYTAIG